MSWFASLRFAATLAVAAASLAQTPAPATAPPARPVPPARAPDTPGFVAARDLPDGSVPSPLDDGNFVIGPTHPPAREIRPDLQVPHGTVASFTLHSEDSHFYPGIQREPRTFGTPDPADPAKLIVTTSHPAPYTRTVTVYLPAGYQPGTELPLIVTADGPDRLLFPTLDNLIAQHRLPAMAAVSIANGGGDAQGSERGLEYDTMSGTYALFVEQEVLPEVERRYHVRLSHNPDGRLTMGNSSGGAAALIMAWFHPELYHRVLAYSGTWINQQWPGNAATSHGAYAFPEHFVADTPRKPLRMWMEVGDRDLLNPNVMRDGMHDWVAANEKLAAALSAKGYAYQFVFAQNAVHVDRAVREQTLPEALEYVWQGYRPAHSPASTER